MTKSEIAKFVAMLVEAFPNAQASTATSEIYERMLADLDPKTMSQVVTNLIQTSRFFPTVAEIRAAALELQAGPRRIGAEAWGDVRSAMSSVGQYRKPAFADPLVTECVRLMGWESLCRTENGTADRARFVELYEGLQERGRKATLTAPGLTLVGGKSAELKELVAGTGRRMP